MKRICVFCGSSTGFLPEYTHVARALGQRLAERNITLVYGGGNVGLMGEIADSVLAAGGEVIGVIPSAILSKEVGHTGLSDLRVVDSMHERKALMAELSDGFIALPGGIGTLEELFEVWTWAQLGMHHKPCGLLDVAGYYQHLITFLEHMVSHKFLRDVHRSILLVETDPVALLQRMEVYKPPHVDKWIDREST